jgi:LAO/AO transport system kinase
VAATGEGVDTLWAQIGRHQTYLEESGLLEANRGERLRREFRRILRARIEEGIDRLSTRARFAELDEAVLEHRLDPYAAAEELLAWGADDGSGPVVT